MRWRHGLSLACVLAGGCYDGLESTRHHAEPNDRNGATQVGRLTSVGNGEHRTWFDYDEAGRVVQTWWQFDGRAYTASTTYGFASRAARAGELGRLVTEERLAHRIGEVGEGLAYAHDSAGALRAVAALRPDGARQDLVTSISTNALGQVTRIVYGTCKDNSCGADSRGRVVTTRDYDPKTLRLARATTTRDAQTLQAFGYAFDPSGNLERIDDHRDAAGQPCRPGAAGCAPGEHSATFEYDSLDRLAEMASGGNVLRYAFSATGNLLSKDRPDDDAPQTIAQQYGGPRRGPHAIARAGSAEFTYDANGNLAMTSGRPEGDFELTYNADNLPVAVRDSDGGVYRKHFVGDNLWKKVEGGTTTWYLPSVRIERTGEDEQTLYYYGSWAERDGDGDLHFMRPDHLGSASLVFDARGEVERRLAYWAWGEERDDYGTDDDYDPRYRFGGKESEIATGFIDHGARLYLPDVGRFASPDPLDLDGSNRYAYVRNNPVRYVDPSGYFAQKPADKDKKKPKPAPTPTPADELASDVAGELMETAVAETAGLAGGSVTSGVTPQLIDGELAGKTAKAAGVGIDVFMTGLEIIDIWAAGNPDVDDEGRGRGERTAIALVGLGGEIGGGELGGAAGALTGPAAPVLAPAGAIGGAIAGKRIVRGAAKLAFDVHHGRIRNPPPKAPPPLPSMRLGPGFLPNVPGNPNYRPELGAYSKSNPVYTHITGAQPARRVPGG